MGVKGLTPFLQKYCPNVLTKLPNRLESLRGKKIVIDGTLITQRFHFMRNDHPYRHILGWYRVAQELNENGISAICVFDGKERHVAKAREAERRRVVRELTESRGSIERDRFQRLRQLKDGLEIFQTFDSSKRREVAAAIKDLPSTEGNTSTPLEHRLSIGKTDEPPSTETTIDSLLETQTTATTHTNMAMSPIQLASHFTSLNISYKTSVSKLVSSLVNPTALPPQATPTLAAEEEQATQMVTKPQYDLTSQERQLWKEITTSLKSSIPEIDPAVGKNLETLVQKSYVMTTSFDRRIDKPKHTTYSESKEILRAMGIPCMDATGAVEAEALASSLVLKGHADYVASEDTDVLVYEVPLLKNITTPSEPIVIVSGPDIRNSLGLDREAYVDLALLMGTDFSDRIKNVGPVHAYQFIKKYGNIEQIVKFLETEPKYNTAIPWDTYLAQVNIARLVFMTMPVVPPQELFQPIEKNDREVDAVLERYGLSFSKLAGDTSNWDHQAAYQITLGGNYFSDAPTAT